MEVHLKSILNISENLETKFTICVYDLSVSQFIMYLDDQFHKIKKVTQPLKKKILHDRLFSLFLKIKERGEDYIIHSLFFIDDKIHEIELTKSEIQTAKEFKLINPFYKTGEIFFIDFMMDFFCNQDFIFQVKYAKSKMDIKKCTRTKEKNWTKNVDEKDLEKELEELRKKSSKIYLCGLKTISLTWVKLIPEILSKKEMMDFVQKEEMLKNHALLQKRIINLQNDKTNLDIYVFGKLKNEIKEAMENYVLKELYIEPKKLKKLKTMVDEDYFNFQIIQIESIENGDIGDIFIRDYNGIMGIRYF